MRAPSGANVGSKSAAGSSVTRTRFVPSASTTYTSSACGGPAEKAIRPVSDERSIGPPAEPDRTAGLEGEADTEIGSATGGCDDPGPDSPGDAVHATSAAMATGRTEENVRERGAVGRIWSSSRNPPTSLHPARRSGSLQRSRSTNGVEPRSADGQGPLSHRADHPVTPLQQELGVL